MRWFHTLTVVGLLGLGAALAAPNEPKADAQRIAQLIAALGSETFAEREEATKALEAIGRPAYEALRKEAGNSDPEVQRRVTDLLAKLDKGIEAEKILKPTLVHLVCKDQPLAEAVKELSRKSGYAIELRSKDAERRVTLDTGETTFWQAMDLLCQKAGLVEAESESKPVRNPVRLPPGLVPAGPIQIQIQQAPAVPAPAPQQKEAAPKKGDPQEEPAKDAKAEPAKPVRAPRPIRPPIQAQILPVIPPPMKVGPPVALGALPEGASAIVLVDGQPEVYPTCYAGAMRIRALREEGKKGGDEAALVLEVRTEPKIQWRQLEQLRLEKAVDDAGQTLKQAMIEAAAPVVNFNGIVIPQIGMQPALAVAKHLIPLRFQREDKPSKALRELAGVLAAKVQTGPHPLVTVDNVMNSAGKTVKGDKETAITIKEATPLENGRYRVRLQLQASADPFLGFGIMGGMGGMRIQAGFGGNVGPDKSFSLMDAKGGKLELAEVAHTLQGINNVVVQEYTLTFQGQKDQGEPAKLVYSGYRTAAIDVPFRFKDVPLQ